MLTLFQHEKLRPKRPIWALMTWHFGSHEFDARARMVVQGSAMSFNMTNLVHYDQICISKLLTAVLHIIKKELFHFKDH